jgi:cholesterol transport system auxiliary component
MRNNIMRNFSSRCAALLLAAVAMLSGCASVHPERAALYDLGPLRAADGGAQPMLPPLAVANIAMPAWLDNTLMFYRLNYADRLQPRPYARTRWTMAPSQLLQQHLKSRIAQAGGVGLAASQGTANVPILQIEADDFTQVFDAPGASKGVVSLRASVFRGRVLVAHKAFLRQAPAPTADAGGGAHALADASNATIADLIAWLATLDLK